MGLFANRLPGFLLDGRIDVNPYGDPMLNLGGLGRYYGPGYERGDYASDSEIPEGGEESTTDEELDEIWKHWASDQGRHLLGAHRNLVDSMVIAQLKLIQRRLL